MANNNNAVKRNRREHSSALKGTFEYLASIRLTKPVASAIAEIAKFPRKLVGEINALWSRSGYRMLEHLEQGDVPDLERVDWDLFMEEPSEYDGNEYKNETVISSEAWGISLSVQDETGVVPHFHYTTQTGTGALCLSRPNFYGSGSRCGNAQEIEALTGFLKAHISKRMTVWQYMVILWNIHHPGEKRVSSHREMPHYSIDMPAVK